MMFPAAMSVRRRSRGRLTVESGLASTLFTAVHVAVRHDDDDDDDDDCHNVPFRSQPAKL